MLAACGKISARFLREDFKKLELRWLHGGYTCETTEEKGLQEFL